MPVQPHRRRISAARLSSITTKGQATIPAEYRRAVGLGPGDLVAFELDGDRIVLRKAQGLDHAWNAAQSQVMSEWASEEDAVFDE